MMMPRGGEESDTDGDGDGGSSSSVVWTRPLTVVHCDESVAIVVKPQGMPVMGSKPSLIRSNLLDPLVRMNHVRQENSLCLGCLATTVAAAPLEKEDHGEELTNGRDHRRHHHRDGGVLDDRRILRKPRPVHRLDAGTGGLLVVAKTLEAEIELKRRFSEPGRVTKTYKAVVVGRLELPPLREKAPASHKNNKNDDDDDETSFGVIDVPLSGKPCRTLYRPLEVVPSRFFGQLTVVELRPQTGRRHQLRRHLHALGHPIVGDSRYSSRVSGGARAPSLPHNLLPGTTSPRGDAGGPSYCRRLCLWAVRIELPHPQRPDETLDCRHPEPIGWLERVLAFERETYSRGVIRPH